MSLSFAQEQSVYPFTHAVVNVALYMCLRDLKLAIILFFLWEPAEYFLKQVFSSLEEVCNDSLVGDPLIGFLAIFAFWLHDKTTNADIAFRQTALPVSRWLVFIIVGLASFLIPVLETANFYWGIVIYTAIYVLAVTVGFWYLEGVAGRSVALWLLAVVAYAIISVPVTDGPNIVSSWMRVFWLACTLIIGALGGVIATTSRSH